MNKISELKGKLSYKYIFLLIIYNLSLSVLFAQNENSETEVSQSDSLDQVFSDSLEWAHAHSYQFTFSTLYMSKVVYRGRDFGLQQHGFVPSLQYKSPSGISFSASGYNWSKIDQPFARWDIGIGWEKKISTHLQFNTNFEKWFFSDDPYFEPDALNKMFSLELSGTFSQFNVNTGIYYIWGTDDALLLNLGFDYNIDVFSYGKNLYVYSNPGILMEAFSGDNLNAITVKKGKQVKTKFTTVHENLSMANYEFSLPLNIELNNFSIEAVYRYAYPIEISNEDPPLSPYLKGGFSYFTCQVSYSIYSLKKNAQRK